MKITKRIALMADTIDGVYETDFLFPEPDDPYDEDAFYNSLASLEPDIVIGCYVTEEMYKKIEEEYGIN